jgi:hypothetical protein
MPLTTAELVQLVALKGAEDVSRGFGSQSYTAEASLGGPQPTAVCRVRITRKRGSAPAGSRTSIKSRKGAA